MGQPAGCFQGRLGTGKEGEPESVGPSRSGRLQEGRADVRLHRDPLPDGTGGGHQGDR